MDSKNTDGTVVTLNDLLEQKKVALKLQFNKNRKLFGYKLGHHLSHAKGSGMVFSEVREYFSGDDLRAIDWKVTARTGTAHTKIYQEEHERPVTVLVDYSKSMQFGTKKCFKSVTAAKAMGMISWLCNLTSDPVALGLFADEKFSFFKHVVDKKIYKLFGQLIKPNWQKEDFNFVDALKYAWIATPAGSTIYIISDFLKLSEDAKKVISVLSQRYSVCFIFIFDQLEKELPVNESLVFSDGENTHTINTFDKSICEKYTLAFEARVNDLQNFCFKNQITLFQERTDG